MSAQVADLIGKVKARGHDLWISGPATRDAIAKIEESIGTSLPPSYVSFLLSYGSISVDDNGISGIVGGSYIDNQGGTALCDSRMLRSEGGLPEGFLVVGPHEDGGYCIDLNRRRADGECPVVNFELGSIQHKKPVADTFEEWLINFRLKPYSEHDA